MKKIEVLRDMFKSVGGILNPSGYCGQYYNLDLKGKRYDVWVDSLKRGRVSIKVKHFSDKDMARLVAASLYNYLLNSPYTVDAATKGDVYRVHDWNHVFLGYGARLICDKLWD